MNEFDLNIGIEDDIMDANINEASNENNIQTETIEAAKVSNPEKKEISADVYNKAINDLQHTFKEGYEVLGMLKNLTVAPKSAEERQKEFTENAMAEAMLKSIEDGPMFEAVEASDKNEVKKIVRKIRDKIDDALEDANTSLEFKPATDLMKITKVSWWDTRLWQVLGVIYCSSADEKEVVDRLNEEFADELGDKYRINTWGYHHKELMRYNIFDIFKLKFGWKTQNKMYFLIVDRKTFKKKSDTPKKTEDDE